MTIINFRYDLYSATHFLLFFPLPISVKFPFAFAFL